MSDSGNPWVIGAPAATEPAPAIEAPPLTRRERLRGPRAPQPATVAAPATSDRLPVRAQAASAALWWVGAHGGAGETTLARLAAGSRAADHAWPAPAAGSAASRVVVVARTDHSGLLAAQRVAREWASGQVAGLVELVGLVLVADAPGRRPKELRQLEQLVAGGYPRAWTLPWIDAWRLGPADPADMGREHQRLLADLQLTSSPR
ncbi:DUF6668 family protein [Clavibacter sp. Sh2088]|uniref:DUF6668 family protein n=1 Tax=Clavibacter sp. Sh2088 TaxID=3397676 RepID=UPI0039E0AF9E